MKGNIMKRTVIAIAAALAASIVVADAHAAANVKTQKRVKIVTTTFPIYDWTREVIGRQAAATDLVLLQKSGVDLHSYTPSAADLRDIASCDLFMFVGGDSDEWTERALAQKGNPNRRTLNLVEALGSGAKAEAVVEGMEHHHHHHHEAHHDHDEDHDEDHEEHEHHHEEEHEVDEHVWLSLRLSAKLVEAIASELAAVDPANAAEYQANAKSYCAKLAELDKAYAKVVANASRKTLLVADRFPFRYLPDDYGIRYYAAFAGCSAESEASFKTIAFLAKKVDELQLPVILTIEGATHKIAETVKRTTKTRDQKLLTLDSLQSTGADKAGSTHYIDVMKRNLETLKAALNRRE